MLRLIAKVLFLVWLGCWDVSHAIHYEDFNKHMHKPHAVCVYKHVARKRGEDNES